MKVKFVEVAGFRGFKEEVHFELPSGFVVLNGRNGSGKSTVLDAIDFAITGTINKYSVRGAKGGGLEDHIWWVGRGQSKAHYVKVGFVDEAGDPFVITHTRERGADRTPEEIARRLCFAAGPVPAETLMQTALIRDELIAAFSLDLPEQARFAAVRTAIGGIVGPDLSSRAAAIVEAAARARNAQQNHVQQRQDELGRALSELTEARSAAERSSTISDALRLLEGLTPNLPVALAPRVEAVRNLVVQKRRAVQQLEAARQRSIVIQVESAFFSSALGQSEVNAADSAVAEAAHKLALAQERLTTAVQLEGTVRESNEFAAHMAGLLEHGSALGLQDGHCPLCGTAHSDAEFQQAIAVARNRLAEIGRRLSVSAQAVETTRSEASLAADELSLAEMRQQAFTERKKRLDAEMAAIGAIYDTFGFAVAADDPEKAETLLLQERQALVQTERALLILESSGSVDRVRSLENRIASLRVLVEEDVQQQTAAEKAFESARQIESSAKSVANEILAEQFDSVMPLLKELYRRLRPHNEWKEIEVEFGGRVRASLNFSVDGRNPQFLFSSGQRRTAGLAFLLAIHLSRKWCRWQSLLLDDPVQHIDDYRALNLVEVLAAIRRSGRQLIIAVEDPALADLLCRRLRPSLTDFGRRFDLNASNVGGAEIGGVQDIHPLPREVLRFAQAS